MSFWSGVADFGLGAQGFDQYTNAQADRAYLEQQRKRQDEIQNIALEKLRREDDLAKQARAIASKYGLGGSDQLPAIPGTTVDVPDAVPNDDEGNPMPLVPKSTPALPAQANRSGMMNELAGAYEKAGQFDQAQKIRAALKQVQSEGYGEILKGVAGGEDPATIAQRFNTQGTKRIVNTDKQGDNYIFQYEDGTRSTMNKQQAQDLGTRLGLFKKDLTIVPHDARVVDAAGNTVAEGKVTPKPDPFQLEEFKADLRDRTERLKASLKGPDAEHKPREVALAEAFVTAGVAPDMKEALMMATEGKNLSPERFKASIVQKLTGEFSDRLASANPDVRAKAQTELGKLADTVTTLAFPARGATKAAPASQDTGPALGREIAASANTKAPPPVVKGPGGDANFTGKYNVAGKPIYRDSRGALFVGE